MIQTNLDSLTNSIPIPHNMQMNKTTGGFMLMYRVSFYEPIVEGYLTNRFRDKDVAIHKANRLIQNGYEEVKIQCEEKIPGSDDVLITNFRRVEKKVHDWKPTKSKWDKKPLLV